MIKRPLNPRFNQAVLDEIKITTIRDKPWPVGQPIMLYNWSGVAYRSKQIDVAEVKVIGYWPILITHHVNCEMIYEVGLNKRLCETEGFDSRAEMDDWFRAIVKNGQTVQKFLMRFKIVNPKL